MQLRASVSAEGEHAKLARLSDFEAVRLPGNFALVDFYPCMFT